LVRVHSFALIVTGMQFLKSSFMDLKKKSIYKRKKKEKKFNDFFIAVLLHYYDLKFKKKKPVV
jgi:hypothetical protein